MQTRLSRLSKLDFHRVGVYLAASTGFAIPLSVTATALLSSASVLCLLLSGVYARTWRMLLGNPVAQASVALFAWLAISATYATVSLSEALLQLSKYKELFLLALLMPAFSSNACRDRAVWTLMASILFMVFLSYLTAFGWFDLYRHGTWDAEVFKGRITHSILLALACLFVAQRLLGDTRWRWAWALLLALLTFNLFVLVSARTGQLIFVALGILLGFQLFRWRGMVASLVCLTVLVTFIYLGSDGFRHRVQLTVAQLRTLDTSEKNADRSLRLAFYKNSWELIRKRPILGYGIGSFKSQYAAHVEGSDSWATTNPHNEYLMLGVQSGGIGIALFLLLLYRHWRTSFALPDDYGLLARGLAVTMALGCFFNSLLLDSTEGHLFAYLSAVLFSAYKPVQLGGANVETDVSQRI